MEKIIERDGDVFKITISEYSKEVWKFEYSYDLVPMYQVSLYKKRKSKKWYEFSDFEHLHSIEFKKSSWEGKFKEMGQNVFKAYDNKIMMDRKIIVEKEKSISEFKNWDGN